MATIDILKDILNGSLQLGERANSLVESSPLLGAIPEFDSMAVVSVLTMIEDEFGIVIADDEVSADVFESLGTLMKFVDGKLNA